MKKHTVGYINIQCMTLTEYNNIVRIIMDIDSHTEPTSSAIILD